MSSSEPSRHWQLQKHQQIVSSNSPTAFAQLSELALPHLINFLRKEFHQVEIHLVETAVIDCLLSYHAAPQKYNPDKLTLFAYLRMAARHDLLNAIDRSNRLKRPLLDIDQLAVQSELATESWPPSDSFHIEQWVKDETDLSQQALLHAFEAELESRDRQLFLLILNGVRESNPYAEIMQLENRPLSEQRREVKRVKDRLIKKLTRFVNRHQV